MPRSEAGQAHGTIDETELAMLLAGVLPWRQRQTTEGTTEPVVPSGVWLLHYRQGAFFVYGGVLPPVDYESNGPSTKMKPERLSASIAIALSLGGFALPGAKTDAAAYEPHDPIVVENVETSPDTPCLIEGYEIANPDGPGIQVRHVDHVVIRNNYLHDCGTKSRRRSKTKWRPPVMPAAP